MTTSAAAWCRGVARLCWLDGRRLGSIVALVVTAEVLLALFIEWSLSRTAPEVADVTIAVVDTLLWLVAAVVTAVVVQADHPTDDHGFLRSRPVSPWQVAIAKLSWLAGLFVVLPSLVNAVRLAMWGAPAAAMLASAVQFAVVAGAIVVPAWALALATRTLPRFLFTSITLAAAWFVAAATLVTQAPATAVRIVGRRVDLYANTTQADVTAAFADWQGRGVHGWIVALLVTLIGAAILLAFYRYRRPWLSLSAGAALMVFPIVLPIRDRSWPADAALAAASHDNLHVPGPLFLPPRFTIADRIYQPGRTTATARVASRRALPVNVSATAVLTTARIAAPGSVFDATDGLIVGATSWLAAQAAADGGAPIDAEYGPLGVERRDGVGLLLSVPQAIDHLAGRVADLDGTARLRFMRHRLVGGIVLQPGVAFATDDYRLDVLSVDRPARRASCRFLRFPTLDREVEPSLTFFDARTGTRLLPATAIDRAETSLHGGPGSHWARGRTWAVRMDFHLLDVGDASVPRLEPRLRIVESRSAGVTTTRVTGRAVPIQRAPSDGGR